MATRTVRDATFDVLRGLGLTKVFSNPGSTEVPLLTDLPDDIEFVLALHEGSVVGMATGWAIGSGRPAFCLLHTTAGLGNAVGALATARTNRAPLVVVVGQQDRRHLASEPFLAGHLRDLAGEYPVHVDEPARAQDVPGAIVRAHHEAVTGRGPALVIVPMDDWLQPAPQPHEQAGARRVARSAALTADVVDELAAALEDAQRPVLVVGAGMDSEDGWAAGEALADRLACPVWQESFGARAGFPQDSPRFAGHLPADRPRLREALSAFDLVLVAGAAAFRQYPYSEGPLVGDGTRVLVVTDDPAEAHRSTADLAVIGNPAAACHALTERLEDRNGSKPIVVPERPAPLPPPTGGEPLRAAHVLDALAARISRDTIVVEETPSSRPDLHARVPARSPMGFVSAAMGGLGFALPAAVGLRMARPDRPVVAIVGDGSAMYQVQALWSAARYRAGVLFVILANGGYAVMDRLAERQGGAGPWPSLHDLDIAAIAKALGCYAWRVTSHEELVAALDEIVPGLTERAEPLLLEVAVAPDATFNP